MNYGKRASSMKQMAYAKQLLGAQGTSKRQIALNCGYSPYVANSISSHIENKPGFNYAMSQLAVDSNNLALAAMHEFKARGFKDFSNKDLIGALNAIGSAWSKFNAGPKEKEKTPEGNKLRTVILQQIENQNLTTNDSKIEATIAKPPVAVEVEKVETVGGEEELDF